MIKKSTAMQSKLINQEEDILLNQLGVMYADGKSVEMSYARAEAYFLKAINLGNEQARSNYEKIRKQKWAYGLLEKENRKAREQAEWRERLTRQCPRCGRNTGHPLNEFEKKMSVSFWGYASSKWGKTYKCDACDYMW